MFSKRYITGLLLLFFSFNIFASPQFQVFNPKIHEKIDGKYAIKNELLIGLKETKSPLALSQLTTEIKAKGIKVLNTQMLSTKSAATKIIKLQLSENQQSLTSSQNAIQSLKNVAFVQPNYIYNIGFDPREYSHNDPKLNIQYHHALMQNIKAWDISTGKNVLVAVTDDGFDVTHEDLSSRLAADIAYNFCDNTTDVTPKDFGGEHGTHVAGIVAAQLDNEKGGAGVAGNADVLPIKFYSSSCNWTSEKIYQAYTYATDQGAKIISTSYNVDGFVGDNTFIAALDYVYEKNVLHFNSAGNNYQQDPPRDVFDQLIFVASTNNDDIKSDFSNYGKKVQISAPGEEILSTLPNNQYGDMSGTSMATPNAAGSAALIWSAHPNWTRDQVAAQLIGTADNIDAKNPQYKGKLGAGRINNYRALTETVSPPKVSIVSVSTAPVINSQKKAVTIAIHFDKLLNPEIMNQGNHWEVKSLSNTILPILKPHTWYIGSMNLDLNLDAVMPGTYQLTLKNTIQDPFGQALAGGNYVYQFTIT